jgi:16S rRNA (uracil1498-N3)-methyltransferase
MPRFFLAPEQWGQPALVGDEARHCAQVHRCRVGQEIQVIDGKGRYAAAEILSMTKQQVSLRLTQVMEQPPRAELILAAAVTKGESFEWILEKAVELGVTRIFPLLTERVIVRLNTAEAQKKQQKWQRLVLEACKQCGQARLPDVEVPQSLTAALSWAEAVPVKLCAALVPEAQRFQSQWVQGQQCVILFIGPEGDFTAGEYTQIFAAGGLPWSLGCFTLRSETAAISAVSMIQHYL